MTRATPSRAKSTARRGVRRRGTDFRPTAGWGAHGRPMSAPSPPPVPGRGASGGREVWGGDGCVTPRQACPRPNGFGRNLRSKTRWFTGFCNSHQVSHFATFFIDARAEISVAESRLDILKTTKPPARAPSPGRRGNALSFKFLGAIHAGVQYAWEGRSSESTEMQHARHLPPRIRGRRAARPSAPKR